MKHAGCLAVSALLVFAAAPPGHADGRFDQKLPPDRQVVHILNRLTFGPRPGDVDQVRRIGLDAWIDQQLHPDRLAENAALADRLRALVTLDLPAWQIAERYPAVPVGLAGMLPSFRAFNTIPPQERNILTACSVDERRALLASFDPEKRGLVLAGAPPQVTEGLPTELVQEGLNTRKAEQEARQKEIRRLMPPLTELLPPEQIRIANNGTLDERRALLSSLEADKRRLVLRALPPQALAGLPALRLEALAISQPQVFVNNELIEQKLYRALYSNRQLEEVLVDFWLNHFNVYNGKGPGRILLTDYEREAIRPFVLGRFKDLLLATARNPAMLYYLDNWQSQAPREDLPAQRVGPARRPGLNENYGRELLELHTLGVDGGYTQQDVIAVARAFTGWTIRDVNRVAEFQFNPAMHDAKEKVVLGHTIPAGGDESDGLQVLDILAHHPSTARFISKQLAQRFVADDPPRSLVDRMAATFTKTDGDLRAVLETLFTSTEFQSEGAWGAKLKSPLEM